MEIRGEYLRLEAQNESDNSSTTHCSMDSPDIPPSSNRIFTRDTNISDYTDVQNAGNPPHSSSEHP
jgi:hypothetical protein